MARFARPVVVISQCLMGERCRYDGKVIRCSFIRALRPYVTFRSVCPEVEIGLGVPRGPVRVVEVSGRRRLIQISSDRDLTGRMRGFTRSALAGAGDVHGFILKSRSPSCALRDARIYRGRKKLEAAGKGAGLFGESVSERFGHLAVEDERRLAVPRRRGHFLTKLFTLAAFSGVGRSHSMARLAAFHAENRMLLAVHHRGECALLDKIVAAPRGRAKERMQTYERHLWNCLARPPRRPSQIRVLTEALGPASERRPLRERAACRRALAQCADRTRPFAAMMGAVRSALQRCGAMELLGQSFFEPYPQGLARR